MRVRGGSSYENLPRACSAVTGHADVAYHGRHTCVSPLFPLRIWSTPGARLLIRRDACGRVDSRDLQQRLWFYRVGAHERPGITTRAVQLVVQDSAAWAAQLAI